MYDSKEKTLAEKLGARLAFAEASTDRHGISGKDAKTIADILVAAKAGAEIFENFEEQFNAAYRDGLRQAREENEARLAQARENDRRTEETAAAYVLEQERKKKPSPKQSWWQRCLG